MPEGHPGKIAFHFFDNNNEKLKDGFIGNLGTRLQLLQSQSLRRITRNKDIDLSLPGEKQCAYFVIIPDQSQSTRALSSMFFNFLFKDLCDAADIMGPQNRLYVDIICDEFANIGVIPGMDTKITIVRSRRVRISIIFQMPSQLHSIYGEAIGDSIVGGCDTLLFLGTNDDATKEWISKKSGEATIAVNTVKNSKGVGRVEPLAKEYAESVGEGKRYVLTPHEVGKISKNQCIVFLKGYDLILGYKFWWDRHPYYLDDDGNPYSLFKTSQHTRANILYSETEGKDPFLADAERLEEHFEITDDEMELIFLPDDTNPDEMPLYYQPPKAASIFASVEIRKPIKEVPANVPNANTAPVQTTGPQLNLPSGKACDIPSTQTGTTAPLEANHQKEKSNQQTVATQSVTERKRMVPTTAVNDNVATSEPTFISDRIHDKNSNHETAIKQSQSPINKPLSQQNKETAGKVTATMKDLNNLAESID